MRFSSNKYRNLNHVILKGETTVTLRMIDKLNRSTWWSHNTYMYNRHPWQMLPVVGSIENPDRQIIILDLRSVNTSTCEETLFKLCVGKRHCSTLAPILGLTCRDQASSGGFKVGLNDCRCLHSSQHFQNPKVFQKTLQPIRHYTQTSNHQMA